VHESVELPEPPVIVIGDSLHDRLVEFSLTVSATVPVKKFTGETLMVEMAVAPVFVGGTLAGLANIVKSGGAVLKNSDIGVAEASLLVNGASPHSFSSVVRTEK
jgi:hypothetical protein